MTYQTFHDFLGGRLNYERRGMPRNEHLRLDRIRMLLERLELPQQRYRVVHVAGTKGKGSTAHMIAALLEGLGLRVGLHTSPHFQRLEERFRVNGALAEPATVAALAELVVPHVHAIDRLLQPDQPELTYFEITTALALLHFARQQVDWAVVEVGMGGRLDSTNVVDPTVAVITSISRDHTRQLGDTLDRIAREKAGIIKPGRPVVSGVTAPLAQPVVRQAAAENGCLLRQLGADFSFDYQPLGLQGGTVVVQTWRRTWPASRLNLFGAHQAANAAVALATIDVLEGTLPPFDPAVLAAALGRVRLPGRLEIVGNDPLVLLDVAHNDASATALVDALGLHFAPRYPAGERVLIFGASRDKDWRNMLEILAPHFRRLILTQYQSNPRADSAAAMLDFARHLPIESSTAPGVAEAWDAVCHWARQRESALGAGERPLICICGSFYLAAEMTEIIAASGKR